MSEAGIVKKDDQVSKPIPDQWLSAGSPRNPSWLF